jgi:phosphatidylglycerophosphate synthase
VNAVRTAPTVGLLGLFGLLAGLTAADDLGRAGWVTGLAYGVIGWIVLNRALSRTSGTFGPADWVTLARAVLAGGVAALAADSLSRPVPVVTLVGMAVVALVLDAVDGVVARRTDTASSLGARFDMEVDAFLLIMLSVYVARTAGAWVLAIGAMRYAFVAAGWALPWLRERLPARYWRKVVAATQGIVLVIAASGVLPVWLATAALVVALGLLVESFGRDVTWLWRRRRVTV